MVSRFIKEKAKFMTNIDATDNMQINWAEIEKLTNYKYLRQTIGMEKQNKTRGFDQNKSRIECFGKKQKKSFWTGIFP